MPRKRPAPRAALSRIDPKALADIPLPLTLCHAQHVPTKNARTTIELGYDVVGYA